MHELEPSQLPGASEVLDLRKAATTSILLDQHYSLLHATLYLLPTETCSNDPSLWKRVWKTAGARKYSVKQPLLAMAA